MTQTTPSAAHAPLRLIAILAVLLGVLGLGVGVATYHRDLRPSEVAQSYLENLQHERFQDSYHQLCASYQKARPLSEYLTIHFKLAQTRRLQAVSASVLGPNHSGPPTAADNGFATLALFRLSYTTGAREQEQQPMHYEGKWTVCPRVQAVVLDPSKPLPQPTEQASAAPSSSSPATGAPATVSPSVSSSP